MLWNSTFWNHLKLTVQLQLALYPYNPFLVDNRNMTSNSVEKYFALWNVIQNVLLILKPNLAIMLLPGTPLPTRLLLLKIFAYPSNKCIICGPELNL